MKNDIKTKSTDFLPQKPGLSGTPTTVPSTNTPTTSPATPAVSDLPPGAPAPSKHVIDLKNTNANAASAASPEPSDATAKNNPFLLGKKSPEEIKVTPAPAAPVEDTAKSESKLPDAPMPEASKPAEPDTSTEDTKQAAPGTAPNMDLAHPESDQPAGEKDSLKDAMVSDDATTKKPKKKLPTWLLVIIIVVAVILIGIITFAVLNAVARPTGL